ncbi:MAG: hypothetical protein J6M55_05865 [Paludibacteraceae bacterium]|nr:hypothetical protein [Paludibacteraceae bacterium]MBQ7996420.1 hypothetical protein [Paludibacteraceae bacterium]
MRLLLILSIAISLIPDLFHVKGHPEVVEENGPYTRVALTDSATIEVYEGDSILMVMTVCAPQCSSCARIYNKEWQLIATPQSPTPTIFPLATIENGRIVWKDNDTWEY